MTLTAASVFSGIGGLDLGLERSGISVLWQVEIDVACRSALARHWPDVARYEDVRSVHAESYCPNGGGCDGCAPAVDLLCGGFPCQDLSVAGRRAGLGGERSGLWWEFYRLMAELAPAWVLVENVPGLLSAVCPDPESGANVPGGACPGGCVAAHGGAMGTLIGAVGGLGYGFAWRVLDARYFGLAQRRKRVFLVFRAGGDGGSAASVLFEPDGSERCAPSGDPEEQDVAGTLGGGAAGRGWSDDLDRAGAFIPVIQGTLTGSTRGIPAGSGAERDVLVSVGFSTQGTGGAGTAVVESSPAITGSKHNGIVAHALLGHGCRLDGESETFVPVATFGKTHRASTAADAELWAEVEVAATLNDHDNSAVRTNEAVVDFAETRVRRLIPVERERLQGFPDDWTRWGADGKEMSTAARERMTGNAVAVPVAGWIANRILAAS